MYLVNKNNWGVVSAARQMVFDRHPSLIITNFRQKGKNSMIKTNEIKQKDALLEEITDYVLNKEVTSAEAFSTARYVLLDTLGCGILALQYPECTKLLGPVVPGTIVPNGTRVPGTSYVLDPVKGAFNIGCMIRWLDYNDTWLAAEWGHPSDNLGGILAVADYISRVRISEGKEALKVREVLEMMIKAHEIQGVLALENSLNRVGLDHVLYKSSNNRSSRENAWRNT